MRTPQPLTVTARELDIPRKRVIRELYDAGLIRRDPLTDEWRATAHGRATGMVTERERSYRHPYKGPCLYTKVLVTAEGRRWLQRYTEAA